MAKQQKKNDKSDQEVKSLLEKLYALVKSVGNSSKELTAMNREFLKVMALVQEGFVKNEQHAKELLEDVRSGSLEITDDFAKNMGKSLNLTEDKVNDIIKKFRVLESIDDDMVDNAKDYIELLEQRYDLIDDEVDLSKNLLRNHESIARAVRDSKNAAMKLAGPMANVDSILEKMVARKVDLSTMFDDMYSSVGLADGMVDKIKNDIDGLVSNLSGQFIDIDLHFNPLSDQLDTEIKSVLENVNLEKNARLDGLMEFFNTNKKLQTQLSRQLAASMEGLDVKIDVDTGDILQANKLIRRGTEEYDSLTKQLDELVSRTGAVDQLSNQFAEITKLIGLGADKTEEQKIQLTKLLEPMGLSTKLLADQVEMRLTDLNILTTSIMKEKDKYTAMVKYANQLQTAESIVQKIGSGFDYINALLPAGIGEFLGLSKVSMALTEAHKRGVQDFATKIGDGATHAEALKTYMQSFKPALSLALNPMTILVTSAILLFKFVEGISDTYKEMTKEMKISLVQSQKLLNVQLDILTSQKNQFATMQDIREAQTAMIGSSGKVFDIMDKGSKELAISLIETGKVFGYGTEQAVELHKVFKRIGADDSLALNLEQNLGLMSEMAGLSPQIIAQDLVDGTEAVYTYFAGMPDKAAKAVIQIRRMGLSLQKAGEIAQNMLDLEGFMTNMYELQAMSGGGIDFSGAFEKGLMGDIQGMAEDIMNNIGTTAEYNNMDYLTRIKIAKTLGMSVDELAKSVKLREDMQGLGESEQKYLQGNLDRMGDISNLSKEEIRNRLQQLQSTDRLGVAWDKIKGVLIKALIPLAEGFANLLDGISPILDVIVLGFKGIAGIMKVIAPLFKLITYPIKLLGDLLSIVTGKVDEVADSANSLHPIFRDLVHAATGFVTIFAGGKLLKGFGLIKHDAIDLIKFIPGIGPLFGKVFKTVDDGAAATASKVSSVASSAIKSTASMADESSKIVGKSVLDTEHIMDIASKKSSGISSNAVKSVSDTIQTEESKVAASTAKMTGQVEASVNKTQKTISKGSKVSFLSSDASKGAFKMVGALAAATFAKMAVNGVMSFINIRKEGEEQMSGLSESSVSMFENLAMIAGPLISTSLMDGFDRVFTKKIEKSFEGKLEGPIKKLTSSFDTTGEKSKGMFSKIGDYGKKSFTSIKEIFSRSIHIPIETKSLDSVTGKSKSIFGKIVDVGKSSFKSIVDFGKNLLPKSVSTMTGTFDNMATLVKDNTSTISDSVSTIKEVLPTIEKTQPIEEKVQRKKTEAIETTTRAKTTKIPSTAGKSVSTFGKSLDTGFQFITKVIHTAWNGIKTVLTDIIKFISTSMKELSSGIGVSIKNLLKGIGEGLSSFKTNAVKGAAAFVLISGALWITSKALENFAKVSWEDVGKGIITLGSMTVAAIALGKISGQVIIGAAAIALLGASLIPAAYALNEFNKVEWASLGKAGVALVGLGVAGLGLGTVAPMMLLGAVALAALGAALIPTAFALEKFNDIDWSSIGKAGTAITGFAVVGTILGATSPLLIAGSIALGLASAAIFTFSGAVGTLSVSITGIDTNPIRTLTSDLLELTSISVSSLFGIAGGISALGMSIMAFGALNSIGNVIGKIFGGDPIKDLERLGNLADPLYIVNKVILELGNSLQVLSESLSGLDLSQISKLKEIENIGLDTKVQEKIEPMMNIPNRMERDNTQVQNVKIVPIQVPIAKPDTPRKESVAQDKRIDAITKKTVEIDRETGKPKTQPKLSVEMNQGRVDDRDIYREDMISDTATIEMLLRQNNQLLELILRKELNIVLDKQRVGSIIKAGNNNV